MTEPNETNQPTFDALKEKASNAASATSTAAHDVAKRASDGLETNPLAVLAGGLALGAIAGALLPRTEQETRVLGPLGRRLSAGATAAAAAARDAGKEQLVAALPDKDSAKDQLRSAFGSVVQAAKEGGKSGAAG